MPGATDGDLTRRWAGLQPMMFLLEVTRWAHRALWHLICSGVVERHPSLQFVFTQQGTAWVPEEPTRLV